MEVDARQYKLYFIISAERRPPLDVGFPLRFAKYLAIRIHRILVTLTRLLLHLIGGLRILNYTYLHIYKKRLV